VHVVIDTAVALVTCIVPLWGKHQMFRKSRVTIEDPNTLYNVPAIKLKIFISDFKHLALESGTAFHFTVDDVIQFVDGLK
jgi:hypothetical protein